MRPPEYARAAGTLVRSHDASLFERALVEGLLEKAPERAEAVLLAAGRRLAERDLAAFLAFAGRHFEGEPLEDVLRECLDGSTQRAFGLLRDVFGPTAAKDLLVHGRLVVRSRNGRSYAVRTDGEVREMKTWGYRCVVATGPAAHPLDVLIAKALTVRDHPERIHTLEVDRT